MVPGVIRNDMRFGLFMSEAAYDRGDVQIRQDGVHVLTITSEGEILDHRPAPRRSRWTLLVCPACGYAEVGSSPADLSEDWCGHPREAFEVVPVIHRPDLCKET